MQPFDSDQLVREAVQKHQAGHFAEAEAIYRTVLARQPDHVDALHFLGVLASQAGKQSLALELIAKAVRLRPDYAAAHVNLGSAQLILGQVDSAIKSFEQAIRLKPTYCEAYTKLGEALIGKDLDRAIACCQRAIQLKPDFAEAHNALGILLAKKWQLDEALQAFAKAIQLNPRHAEFRNNYGNVLKEMGETDRAIDIYREAFALAPHDAAIHSNLIVSLHNTEKISPSESFAQHLRWARCHADPLKAYSRPHQNSRDPNRKLRIGYVSQEFTSNPVGRFMMPLLEHHDQREFEIFAYASLRKTDDFTDRIKSRVDVWRDILGISDEDAASLVRQDQIDILVDLAAHTAGHRLLVFARKPAPIQITYLAYAGTTGLDVIDYRLTDPHLDPPDMPQEFYSEKSIRLPETYWCYEPPFPNLPEPLVRPDGSEAVTFGGLNSFAKGSTSVLELWSEVLREIQQSRLALHAPPGSTRERVRELFSRRGIGPNRIAFIDRLPLADYLNQYNQIDIALDPFPHVGGTTTCDALWMGVPVVTLAGKTAISRGGVSLLSNIGLPELIARSRQDYVRIAADLARDLDRLNTIRTTLRERMRRSPVMDAEKFAKNVEIAYRRAWITWCSSSAK